MEETDSSSKKIFRHFHEYTVSEIAWFSFDAFPNFLHRLSQKTRLTFDSIWLFGRLLCTKSLENFSSSFIQNRFGKFYSHLDIAITVHLLVSKV